MFFAVAYRLYLSEQEHASHPYYRDLYAFKKTRIQYKSMENFFTGEKVSSDFIMLVYNQSVSIDDTQLPYYAYAPEIPPVRPGAPIAVPGCAPIPTGTDDTTKNELVFLDMMGLLLRDSKGAQYISPKAKVLYTSGLYNPDALEKLTPPARDALLKSALQLFSEYTIPGRIAWLQAAGQVSTAIQPRTALDHEILDMQQTILSLRSYM